jgi:hypothetical protein
MTGAFGMTWPARAILVASLLVAAGGCFLMPSPTRPESRAISGPAPYVENCVLCHAAPTAAHYAESRHTAKGIRCGQCHTPGGHPDFTEPVRDGKCGGCHQPEYQQTLASKHFLGRVQRSLDGDQPARAALRRDGFTAPAANARRFVGDSSSGEMGGRLCAACHYDEHRLGLGDVQRPDFCLGCHGDREGHFPGPTSGGENRCVACHVRVGETVAGQVVNAHGFAVAGSGGPAR